MITAVAWRGGIDGTVTLSRQGACPRTEQWREGATELELDRPGDLVVAVRGARFPDEGVRNAALVTGFALATRGVEEGLYIPQIVERTAAFLRAVDPSSLRLLERLEKVKRLLPPPDGGGEGGLTAAVALRERILAEVQATIRRARPSTQSSGDEPTPPRSAGESASWAG